MSLAVVRCPGCRGASRVAAEALGQMVGCPRCQMPFVAEEEVAVVPPVARPAPRPPAPAVPVARPRPAEPEYDPNDPAAADEVPDPEHDPHSPPVAGLPVSVLMGLALVPFAIPLLWLAGPAVTGLEPALSMAVPVALAFSASALCLGVVYTVDWTAMTRVKGVLMLVGLAYLSAAGLFFLKKSLMDDLRGWGDPTRRWATVTLDDGRCRVKMPASVSPDLGPLPLGRVVPMKEGRVATYQPDPRGPLFKYRVAVSAAGAPPAAPDDAWFDRVGAAAREDLGAQARVVTSEPLTRPAVGREWRLDLGENAYRVVRVYVTGDRVYFLSAEGPDLAAKDEEFGQPFFDYFAVGK